MQDVFAKALTHLGDFRSEASPLTWLMKIATHHCLNVLRAERAPWHQRFRREEQARGEGHGGPQLFEDREAVRTLLARCDLETQAAAIHYCVDEMTLEEIYFSGHAKAGALRLGETTLPLDALKNRLAQAPADVRIGIFDSCRSGLLTRTKGARQAPAFEMESKGARDAQGLVILTSSASDEDSQESDLIGGSYFSHHLVSGLLGGADRSGDGRVTLFEAYAYAYDRTVADTAESAAGAQHPTFSYDLAGNGDLVLTDVGGRREGLYFPRAAPSGVYYLVDGRGFVAAEVIKSADAERRIALAPGRYRVKRRLADRLRVGEVEIARGQLNTLDENALRDAPFAEDPVKGGARAELAVTRWTVGLGGSYQAIFDSPSRENLFPATGMLGLDMQLHNFFRRDWVWGVDLAVGAAVGTVILSTGGQVPFHFSEGRRHVDAGRVAARARDPLRGRAARAAAHGAHLRRRADPQAELLDAVAGHRGRGQAAARR